MQRDKSVNVKPKCARDSQILRAFHKKKIEKQQPKSVEIVVKTVRNRITVLLLRWPIFLLLLFAFDFVTQKCQNKIESEEKCFECADREIENTEHCTYVRDYRLYLEQLHFDTDWLSNIFG